MDKEMLEKLGKELENHLDRVEFIGVQDGFGLMPSMCTFNCLVTGTTILINSVEQGEEKLKKLREKY